MSRRTRRRKRRSWLLGRDFAERWMRVAGMKEDREGVCCWIDVVMRGQSRWLKRSGGQTERVCEEERRQ
jgi:hypothetical protein